MQLVEKGNEIEYTVSEEETGSKGCPEWQEISL